jgi:glutamine amidotransferase
MCLLTFIPKGVMPDRERFARAAESNPDGFGFAISRGTDIVVDRDMAFAPLWDRFVVAREQHGGIATFHFRITTHGATELGNCHPFFVGGDNQSVLAHNGILPIEVPKGDARSDTQLFAQHVLPQLGGVAALDDDDTFDKLEEWATGSKMVIISTNPLTKYEWYIVNERLGHWDKGIWWSNYSYLPATKYTYLSYGSKYPASCGYSHGGWSDNAWFKTAKAEQDAFTESQAAPPPTAEWLDANGEVFSEEVHEVFDTWLNEMYDEHLVERFAGYIEVAGICEALLTCPNCDATFVIDPLVPQASHCGECGGCFVCGEEDGCDCWDQYPYGTSVLYRNDIGEGRSVVFHEPAVTAEDAVNEAVQALQGGLDV